MRVLVAPDKLKGSLTAAEVADAITAGVLRVRPDAIVHRLPIADGGDGTVDALVTAGGATAVEADVPTGAGSSSAYPVRLAALTATPTTLVAEVAQVGGLKASRPTASDAWRASSWSAGALIKVALDLSPERLIVGVGGTASTDAGAGALMALGAVLLDGEGRPIGPGLDGLARVASVDLSGLDERLVGPAATVELVLATDVDCPLNGPSGAVRMFGPQKGLAEQDLAPAAAAVERFARLLEGATGVSIASMAGAGAGGGLAGSLAAAAGIRPRLGAEIVLDLVGLDAALRQADVVVTAEGSLDAQSLRGKAPMVLARRAGALGVPCLAVAGAITLTVDELRAGGITLTTALLDRQPDLARSIADAPALLADATAELMANWQPM